MAKGGHNVVHKPLTELNPPESLTDEMVIDLLKTRIPGQTMSDLARKVHVRRSDLTDHVNALIRRSLVEALEKADGNVHQAAIALDISHTSMISRLRRLNIPFHTNFRESPIDVAKRIITGEAREDR